MNTFTTAPRLALALFLTTALGVLTTGSAHAQGMAWPDVLKDVGSAIKASPKHIVSYALVNRAGRWYRLARKVQRPGLETNYLLWGEKFTWFVFNPGGTGVSIITHAAKIDPTGGGFVPDGSQGTYQLRQVIVSNAGKGANKLAFMTAEGGKEGVGGVVLNAQPYPAKSAHAVPQLVIDIFRNRQIVPARYQ